MKMQGYKLFNKDLTNQYNDQFVVGKKYVIEKDISYGVNGLGFHFASHLEDTLRFGIISELNVNCVIGLINAGGKILTYEDEYYGYYDLYCSSEMEIIKVLSHEDTIKEADKMYLERLLRFIQGYKLSIEEQNYFLNKFSNNRNLSFYIDYYQRSLKR